MLFWHVGGAVFLFRRVFRDSRADLRFLVAGALLPDALDAVVVVWRHPDTNGAGRGLGHTLLLSAFVMALGMLVTHRHTMARKRVVVLSVGMMFHLLLDGMWAATDLLLWPLPGSGFPDGVEGEWSDLPESLFQHPLRLVQEVVGLAYLLWLVRRADLSDPVARSRLLRSGIIEQGGS